MIETLTDSAKSHSRIPREFRPVTALLISSLFVLLQSVNAYSEILKTRVLQIEHTKLNFSVEKPESHVFYLEEDWRSFWEENSRNIPAKAPETDVDWESEVIIALLWPNDMREMDRFASFVSARIEEVINPEEPDHMLKQLQLSFVLTKPCFSFITDRSPVQFLVFDQKDLKFEDYRLETIKSTEEDCDGGIITIP